MPPRLFEFHFIELSANHIALECLIENVYPEPQMLLLFSKQNHHSNYLELLSSSINITHSENCLNWNNKMMDDSCQSLLYNASIQHSIDSILTAGTIYECRIKLRGTYYVRKKRIKIIFPTSKSFFSFKFKLPRTRKLSIHSILIEILFFLSIETCL